MIPGSVSVVRGGRAQIFTLAPDEGGRRTPFAGGYSPQLFFGATDVTATLMPEDCDLVTPGSRAEVSFSLRSPVAMETGMRFAIREGGKTVGAGVITSLA